MTYTPTQLEVIKTFGRKELTEGCYIIFNGKLHSYSHNEKNGIVVNDLIFFEEILIEDNNFEILGHIPHLEDVFRVAKDRKMFYGIKGEYVKEKEFEYIEYLWFSNMDIGEKCIPYNPTILLLEQPESVLIQLLTKIKG